MSSLILCSQERETLKEISSASIRSALARLETRWQPVTVLAGEQSQGNVALG